MAFLLSNDVINYCYHAMGNMWQCEARLLYEANQRALGTHITDRKMSKNVNFSRIFTCQWVK